MFSVIPLVIFDVIHSYLCHYDYRQLLNTSHSIFAEPKYETAYYVLSEFSIKNQLRDSVMEECKKRVRSPQNQICVRWYCRSSQDCSSFCQYCSGIHSLRLLCHNAEKIVLPLFMFTTVFDLTLVGTYITSLSGLAGGVQGDLEAPLAECRIQALTLAYCPNLKDISEIKKISGLKQVKIDRCKMIEDYCALANIEEVEVKIDTPFVDSRLSNLSGENQKSLTLSAYRSAYFSVGTSLLMSFRHLTSLTLECLFDTSCDFNSAFGEGSARTDIKRYSHIRYLKICPEGALSFKCFPQLLDLISVELAGFDISSWNQTFSSLSSAVISFCILPSDLSCFKFISQFTLRTRTDSALDFTGIFNDLKEFYLDGSNNVTSLTINSKVRNIRINWAVSLHTISGIGIVKSLDINCCHSLTQVEGLINAGSCRLSYLKDLKDFTFLQKISVKLVIHNCPDFDKERYSPYLNAIPVCTISIGPY
jgi:hypothetical protein